MPTNDTKLKVENLLLQGYSVAYIARTLNRSTHWLRQLISQLYAKYNIPTDPDYDPRILLARKLANKRRYQTGRAAKKTNNLPIGTPGTEDC